jgi:hypothetical protein
MFQLDTRDIPYTDQVDLLGAFDMIENIEDDVCVPHEIDPVSMHDGGAVSTMPRHPTLWNVQYECARRERRYRRREPSDKLQRTDFCTTIWCSFVHLLLPFLPVLCWGRRWASHTLNAGADFKLSAPFNALLYRALRPESGLTSRGVRLPTGDTRLVAAVKVASTSTDATCRHTPSGQPGLS